MEPTREELLAHIAELQRQLSAAQARIAQLERLVDDLTRGQKRQAAPFSKGQPKQNRQKPGRKPGSDYGPKAHRAAPSREPDEVIPVPMPTNCQACGGAVQEERVAHQYQLEVPRRAILRRFDIHIGRCRCCGRRIQPRHPLQTSDALGAAASQLGPDAQALMALLKNKYGLSYGDIRGLFHDGYGIDITRGGATQIVLRAADRAEPIYADARQIVRQSERVTPDETGWKVGGRLQWLWTFVSDLATVYVIRPSRGLDVIDEVLGRDYVGRMTHDGWAPYDRLTQAVHQQCVAHLLRRARELLELACGGAARFPGRVKQLLCDALALRDRREAGTISDHGLASVRGRLERRLDGLMTMRLSYAPHVRFQNHLSRHRDEILTFLYDPRLDATNWRAEQAIRPAVVNRKVFGGNRESAGAHAQEVLASLFATALQWKQDLLEFLSQLIRSPAATALPR